MAKMGPKTARAGSSRVEATSSNRRERLASFETARKKEQRRRSLIMLLVCVVLAAALLAYPVYLFVDDYRASAARIDELGATVSAAGCDPVATNAAKGNQQHVADGTPVTYDRFPPDSGPHYSTPAAFTSHFYRGNRPAVQTLVHNLEHGYTIAWYRATMPEDQIKTLERISKTFSSDAYNPAQKFVAAPWNDADGAGFPAGRNVVLAHWYADPSAPADIAKQNGIRQACSVVSGAAVKDFMAKYPYTDSPEPNGG